MRPVRKADLLSKRKLFFLKKKILPNVIHKGEFRRKETVPLRPRFGTCHSPEFGGCARGLLIGIVITLQ